MDAFSYLSVLISLILGLAITQVLKGFRGLMQARSRLTSYWPAVAWAILVMVIAVQSWWAMFGLREHTDWTFLQFSVVLLQTVAIYLLSAIVLPDFFGDATVSLREHYENHRVWFFSLLVGLIATSIAKTFVIEGKPPEPIDLGFHALFAGAGISGVLIGNPRYHAFLALLGAFSIAAYIALLYTHLH
jgi:hypothetical protein